MFNNRAHAISIGVTLSDQELESPMYFSLATDKIMRIQHGFNLPGANWTIVFVMPTIFAVNASLTIHIQFSG